MLLKKKNILIRYKPVTHKHRLLYDQYWISSSTPLLADRYLQILKINKVTRTKKEENAPIIPLIFNPRIRPPTSIGFSRCRKNYETYRIDICSTIAGSTGRMIYEQWNQQYNTHERTGLIERVYVRFRSCWQRRYEFEIACYILNAYRTRKMPRVL